MRYRFSNANIRRRQNRPRNVAVIGIILLVVAIAFTIIGHMVAVERRDNPIMLFDERVSEISDPSDYAAYIDIVEEPVQFAFEGDEGYYFIWDGTRYGIAKIDGSEISQIRGELLNGGSVHLHGYFLNLTDEIRDYAINTMNSGLDASPVNGSNYGEYFGNVGIDVELGELSLYDLNMWMAAASLPAIFAIFFLIEGLWNMHCFTRYPAKCGIDMERFDREADSPDSSFLPNTYTYLTENYIAHFYEELYVFRYYDIVLVTRVIDTEKNNIAIKIGLKNGEEWTICGGKNNDSVREENDTAIGVILSKNPQVKSGFSPEEEKRLRRIRNMEDLS